MLRIEDSEFRAAIRKSWFKLSISWLKRDGFACQFFISVIFLCICPLGWANPLHIESVRLNADSVKKYEKLELTIIPDGLEYENPYNPNEVDLRAKFISPSGKEWVIWGFYDGKNWKIRFAANEIGAWHYRVALQNHDDVALSAPGSFVVTKSMRHGWLRISPVDPHYFIHDDGTAFFGIGQAGGKATPPWVVDNLLETIRDMGKHGLNTLLVWWGAHYPLESEGLETENTGVGRYDQSQAQKLDRLVEAAEKNNIILIPVLWSHNQFHNRFSHTWNDPKKPRRNPYHHLRDGQMPAKEWSTDPEALAYQKKLLRYIIARWSYSSAIGMWEIFTEIKTPRFIQTERWTKETNNWLKHNDPFQHPTTVSVRSPLTWSQGYQIVDVIDFHFYKNGSGRTRMHRELTGQLAKFYDFRKPFIVGEFGIASPLEREENFLASAWAVALSGSAMTPLYWWMANDRFSKKPGTLPWEKYLILQGQLAKFTKDIPFGKQILTPVKNGRAVKILIKSDTKKTHLPSRNSVIKKEIRLIKDMKASLKVDQTQFFFITGADSSVSANGFINGRAHAHKNGKQEFIARFSKEAKLIIEIEGYSRSGAKLTVSDEKGVLFRRLFSPLPSLANRSDFFVKDPQLVEIPLTEGVHRIRIENQGKDWFLVKRYLFKGIVPQTHERLLAGLSSKSFDSSFYGLHGGDRLYGFFIPEHREIERMLEVNFLQPGAYRIEWWNPINGDLLSSMVRSSNERTLTLEIPSGETASACKIVRIHE
ncbi:MAG: DUF5060 domain-containing protein [Methylohalobius sp. ZOD2]